MKLVAALVMASLIIAATVVVFADQEQTAEAKYVRKVHFTQTVQSNVDPAQGRSGEEMALLLSPNPGTLYVGTLTYTASSPVKVMILHELQDGDAGNQPIWTVDGNTKYAVTFLEPATSNSLEFTGAALALHSNIESFEATASMDGWIRGEPVDMVVKTVMVSAAEREPELKLARTILPATLPMHIGMYDGGNVSYVITDASNQHDADHITKWQNYNITVSTLLENVPEEVLGKVYLFKNGISGDGIYGYQTEIFSSTPEQPMYGSLRLAVMVEWNKGQKEHIFESEEDLLVNVGKGRVVLEESNLILNMPQVKWPDGQMPYNATLTLADYEESPYTSGSQILSIDDENMTVTFVAHREWALDGKTMYCIPVAATPEGPASAIGVVNAPASSMLANSVAAADYYEFKNGISGSGPLGFQPSIRNGTLGDENYSPMQKINIVEWINPGYAQILGTIDDINAAYEGESITIMQARPLNDDHVINCPIVNPDIKIPNMPESNMTQTDNMTKADNMTKEQT